MHEDNQSNKVIDTFLVLKSFVDRRFMKYSLQEKTGAVLSRQTSARQHSNETSSHPSHSSPTTTTLHVEFDKEQPTRAKKVTLIEQSTVLLSKKKHIDLGSK